MSRYFNALRGFWIGFRSEGRGLDPRSFDFLVPLLDNRKLTGGVYEGSKEGYSYTGVGYNTSSQGGAPWAASWAADNLPKVEERYCDAVAVAMNKYLKGCPSFNVFWPQERRDRAIAAIKTFYSSSKIRELKPEAAWEP